MLEKYFDNSDLETKFTSPNVILTRDRDIYLRNGTPLKRDDGANIGNSEFDNIIQEEVVKYISRSFDNIIVLAGAGASVVTDSEGVLLKKYGKTLQMIAENIDAELSKEKDFFTLQEVSEICNYKVPVKITENGSEKFNNNFNLEDFLSMFLTYEQFMQDADENFTKYEKTKSKIFQIIIKNTDYNFDSNDLKHEALIKLLSGKIKSSNKLSVVTTNYDTLFEDAANVIGVTVFDGFSFTHEPSFDSNMFDWNLVKDIPHVKTKEREYKRNVMNLLKIHGSLTWEERNGKVLRKNKNYIKKPILIFPSSDKYMQSYQAPYFEMFTKFQDMLSRPNTLLITIGFSFADNHISKIISQAIKHNTDLALLVSDFNIKQTHDNWKTIENLKDNNYQVAFLKSTLNSNLVRYLGGN